MSKEVVGLENIPNVYISRVKLEDNNTETFKAIVTLQVLDVKTNRGYIWKDEESFVDFFKVGLIATRDVSLATAIKEGTLSPYPSKIVGSSYYNASSTEIKKTSIKTFNKVVKSASSVNPGVCQYHRNFVLELPMDPQDYIIFAYGFIDTQDLSAHFEIDLTGLLKQYFGAVTSEIIFKNGSNPGLTNLFLQSDTGVWPGPVHLNAAGYMAGSFSSLEQKPVLKRVKVQNLKLVDLRTNIYKSKNQSPFNHNPLIGTLHYSINENIDLIGVFAINMKQIVLQKTKHGKTFKKISNSLFNEFMFSIKINSLSIVRNQVRTRRVINNLGTPKVAKFSVDRYKYITTTVDDKANKLKPTEAIHQIYLNQDPTIRYYQFKDNENTSKTSGQFSYKAEFSIVDKSQQFFETKMKAFTSQIDSLEQSIYRLNKKTNYSHREERLREGIEIPETIKTAIISYITLRTYLVEMQPFEVEAEIVSLMKATVTENYTATMGLKILNDFKAALSTFRRLFPPINRTPGSSKPKNNKRSMIPNLISFTKEFAQIIQFNNYRRFYKYMNDPYDLNSIISIENLKQRSNLEEQRYFNLDESKFPAEFSNLDDATAKAITNTATAKQIYLSPLAFVFDNQSFNLTDLTNIDNLGLSIQFLRAKQVSDQIIRPWRASQKRDTETPPEDQSETQQRVTVGRQRAPTFNGSFTPGFDIPEFKIEEEQKERLADSKEYLGINSSFIEAEAHLHRPSISSDYAMVATLLSTTQAQTGASKFNFDLTNSDSSVSQYVRSDGFKNTILGRAPVSYKAAVCSRSQAAKNEILSEEGDIFQSPETKISTEILFQTNKRLLVLVGYKRDNQGDLMLSEPIWEEMNHSFLPTIGGVLVKMEYAEIPELGLKPDEIFKLPSTNDVIVVGDQPVTVDITTLPDEVHAGGNINMLSKNHLSKVIKFATTNIVTQGTFKDSLQFAVAPLGSVGPPTIEQVDQATIGGVSDSPVAGFSPGPYIPGGTY